MEKDIKVSGRPKDLELLKKATEQAASEFKEQAGYEVKTEVDDQLGDKSCVPQFTLACLRSAFPLGNIELTRPLPSPPLVSPHLASSPERSAGGVTIRGYGSRITVNNTLDERLRLLEESMLPALREKLFGKNENRRVSSPRLILACLAAHAVLDPMRGANELVPPRSSGLLYFDRSLRLSLTASLSRALARSSTLERRFSPQ